MTVRHFRLLLTASLLISIFAGCLDLLFPALLPESIRQAAEAESLLISTPRVIAMGILATVLVALMVVVYYGLYRLRPWAPKWALWSTILSFPLVIFGDTVIQSGFASVALYVASYCWGAVLTLVFLPPFSHQFKRKES